MTSHRAGLVKAEINAVVVVGEELFMAYLQIGVWGVAEILSEQEARRVTALGSTVEA